MLMKKGLLSLFVAVITLAGVQASFAVAPVLSNIPDVIIGDEEDNGVSDNNFFRFTDAFRFDDYVVSTDPSTTASALLWSFDEVDVVNDPQPQWYTINGKDPVHTTIADQATSDPQDHVSPAAQNELRQGNEYATFRDIVFSPTPDALPYATPSADHSIGKSVTFFVSDGTLLATQEINVSTVDNAFDQLTGSQPPYVPFYDDELDTSNAAWLTGGATSGIPSANTFSFNATTGAYSINVFTNGTGTYKFAYWYGDRPFWLPYASVGTDKYVRAKYFMYATGQSGGTTDDIPNFNMKLQNRFAVTSEVFIQTHDESSPGDLAVYQELRPSTDPNNPSLYRVDFDPVDVPFLSTNTNVSGQFEGIQPSFEAFVLSSTDNGTIAMSELELGTYPISALGSPVATQIMDAVQVGDPSGAVDTRYNVVIGAAAGVKPTTENTSLGNILGSAAGTAFDSSGVPTDRIGYLDRLFTAGATTGRMRIAENEVYQIRYHMTSNRPTSTQGWIWLQNRTARFGYNVYLQLAGGGTTGTSRGIARETLPGAGNLNPDKLTPGENGGWYTVLMSTPLDSDIAPDRGGATVASDFPLLSAAPGRGNVASSTYGDIRVHAQVYDSLSQLGLAETNAEASVFLVDRIEINAYTQVQDGDN